MTPRGKMVGGVAWASRVKRLGKRLQEDRRLLDKVHRAKLAFIQGMLFKETK